MSAKPLTNSEKKWLAELEKLLLACPSGRLGAFTTGDATLHFYDKKVHESWLTKTSLPREGLPGAEEHKRAGSNLGSISTGFQIDSL